MFPNDMGKVLLFFIFVGSIFTHTNCSFTTHTTAVAPSWLIDQERVDDKYFHGFGQVEKSGRRQDYVKECHNIAMEQISNSIRTNVKIQTTRTVIEQESLGENSSLQLDKSFDLISDIRSETVLRRVEQVGEWEDDSNYYVYKRLSITDYEYPMRMALQSALKEYVKGMELKQTDPEKSLIVFFNAYRTLVPYFGESLREKDPFSDFNSINIDAELRLNIRDLLMRVAIIPIKESIKANVFNPWDEQMDIETGFEIDGVFISARFPIRYFPNKNETRIIVKPDLTYWAGNDMVSRIAILEFENSLPSSIINVNQEPVNIYLNLSELSLGKETNHLRVKPAIINVLKNEMNAVIHHNSTSAEYMLTVNIDTEVTGHIHTLYTAMAKMNYYLSNKDGIIFSGTMPDVKGSQMSDERASDAALHKMAEIVESTFKQQIQNEFQKGK